MFCTFKDYLNSVTFLCHFECFLSDYFLRNPLALASLITAEIPFLLISFNADVISQEQMELLQLAHEQSSQEQNEVK